MDPGVQEGGRESAGDAVVRKALHVRPCKVSITDSVPLDVLLRCRSICSDM